MTKQQLKLAFPGKTFTIKQLKKGGIVLTPEKQKDVNAFLQHDRYNPQYFGQHIYIHFPQSDSDQRPWLCINKVPQTYNLNHLATQINDIHPDIKVEGLHRKQSTTYQTTLILFKTSNEITQNLLLHHSIQINQSTSQITKYIPKTQTRCTNCQKLGHLRKQCKQKSRCVRCAGYSCLPHNCKSASRKCVNCGLNHSASYKNCPILKQHTQDNFNQKRQKTYADIVTSSYNAVTDLQTTQTNSHNETTNQIDHLNEQINKLRNTVTNLTNCINNYLHQNNNFITALIAKAIIATKHMTSPIDIVRQTTQTYMNMAGTQQQNTPNDNTKFTDEVYIHDLANTLKPQTDINQKCDA